MSNCVKAATGQVCAACPWRRSNQGKPHPHGWYSKRNLRRLWTGLRTGEAPGMTCHPTDSNLLVPDGYREARPDAETVECSGALLLVQRELRIVERMVLAEEIGGTREYLRTRRRGLTRAGLMWWIGSRYQFAGTPLGGAPMPGIPEDPDVGYDDAVPEATP